MEYPSELNYNMANMPMMRQEVQAHEQQARYLDGFNMLIKQETDEDVMFEQSQSGHSSAASSCGEAPRNTGIPKDILFDVLFLKQPMECKAGQRTVNLAAKCLLCPDKTTIIRGAAGVTSNFITHLKRKHPAQYEYYSGGKYRKVKTPCKGMKRDEYSARETTPQEAFNQHVLDFIVNTATPLALLDSAHFRKLFTHHTELYIPSAAATASLLSRHFQGARAHIKAAIARRRYFCATVDVWTYRRYSYFGYTCHWLEQDYRRVSAALGCRRLPGMLNAAQVGTLVQQINEEYELSADSIVVTATQNGFNCLPAFQCFGVQVEASADPAAIDVKFAPSNIDELLEMEFQNLDETATPTKSIACASRALNLIATQDFGAAIKVDPNIYNIHLQAFAKCSTLWRLANNVEAASKMHSILQQTLEKPCLRRWRTFYTAVQHIIAQESLLYALCTVLAIPCFSDAEFAYLKEYCRVMTPFAQILNFLQDEPDVYYGMLLPSLATLKVKTDKLLKEQLSYLAPVTAAIQTALTKRFAPFFQLEAEAHDAIVAAMSYPSVKLKWFKAIAGLTQCKRDDMHNIFLQYCRRHQLFAPDSINDSPSSSKTASFFDFGDDNCQDSSDLIELNLQPEEIALEKELQRFLYDMDVSLKSLQKYPTISLVFERANTPLPSSGAVERLLSFVDIAVTPQRDMLSAAHFEQLVLVKANSALFGYSC